MADDISDAIKEILQSKKTAADHVISDLHKHNLDLVNIFKELFEELSFENVIDLGILLSSHSITNDEIILSYVRHMLIKQVYTSFQFIFKWLINTWAEIGCCFIICLSSQASFLL